MAVVIEAEDRFRDLPVLDREDGSALSWDDRLFIGFRDGKIFDYSDWAARDMAAMMRKPGKHRQIEAVLTYPTIAAERHIVAATTRKSGKASPEDSGTNEISQWMDNYFDLDEYSGGCSTPLDLVLDQMTSAVIFKKSFHEIEWTEGIGDYAGQVVPKGIYWRPQSTTRLLRDPRHGNRPVAIEQDPMWMLDKIKSTKNLIEIKINRALVHIHGARRDPINGVSDLEVPYWAYKTQQRILFLWMQFAENVSLPKAIVRAQDTTEATNIAKTIARTGGSGIIPIGTEGRPDSVLVDLIDMSGKGDGPFKDILAWIGQEAVNSVLAGFLNLTNNEKSGGGWALSNDASDFFVQTLESKNREYERSIRNGPDATGGGLFVPMVRWNFGPNAPVPRLKFSPLNAEDKSQMVEMLTDLMRSRDPSLVPDEYIEELVVGVADYLGMDSSKLRKAFVGAAEKARQLAQQQMQAQAQATQTGRGAAIMAKSAGNVAAVGGATRAAVKTVNAAKKAAAPKPKKK